MNVITRGMRNAFRNLTRTISIVIILSLSMGLSLVMLIAHQAVQNKITATESSIGNTITIQPAGYSSFSQANNALTTSEVDKIKHLKHVTNVAELLTDHLTTQGSTSGLGGGTPYSPGSSGSNATTSLKSAVTLGKSSNSKGNTYSGGGTKLFLAGGGTLPSNFTPPLGIVGTNEPTNPSSLGGVATSLKITSGTAIDGTKADDKAMISTEVASKNNLHVGSTFTAYGTTLTVAAIFDSGTESGNNYIIVSLPTEQKLTKQSDVVTTAIATADSLSNLSSTTSAVKNQLGSKADVTSSLQQAEEALQPLGSVKNISLYSLIGAVVAGAVIILLTMVMIVRERRREIGILKAIGFSNIRIMLQFICEALTFTILGGVIGLGIGFVGGNPVTSSLVSNSANAANSNAGPSIPQFGNATTNISNSLKDIHAQIGWGVILYGLGAAVIIAFVGSALASYFISKVRPAEVLRSE